MVNAVTLAVALDVVRKTGRDDGGGGDAVLALQRPGKFGDTRRATVSAAHTDNCCVAVFFDFRPQLGFIGEHAGLLVAQFSLYIGTVPFKPVL